MQKHGLIMIRNSLQQMFENHKMTNAQSKALLR